MSLLFQEWEENQKGPKYFPPGMKEHNGPHELKNKSLWKIRTFFYHESLQEQHDRDDLPDQIEILSSREEIPADVPPEPPLAQPEAISPCPVAGNPWLQSRRAEEKFQNSGLITAVGKILSFSPFPWTSFFHYVYVVNTSDMFYISYVHICIHKLHIHLYKICVHIYACFIYYTYIIVYNRYTYVYI